MERPSSQPSAERRAPRPAAIRLHDGSARNPGARLDLDVIHAIRVNRSAVERRAATIPTRRTVKKEWQSAWLLRAITLIDLTTLGGDDTPSNVQRLCAKAKDPVRADILAALGAEQLGIKVAAVCVYHEFVGVAVEAERGHGGHHREGTASSARAGRGRARGPSTRSA